VSETTVITESRELRDHPAVRAWRRVQPGAAPPRAAVLRKSRKKSEVWRLVGATDGRTLIAKLGHGETVDLERVIYREILPQLPVSSIRCHGWTEEPGSDRRWIFLDDAGDVAISKRNPGHRVLAARWLAALHTSARDVAAIESLPDRGPKHYREHLAFGLDRIQRHLSDPTLAGQDRDLLEGILGQLRRVESHWGEVEERCAPLPRTLVHGDFKRKNVRIRTGGGRRQVLAMDWEMAGVGIPGPDLLYLDVPTYRKAIQRAWPRVGAPSLVTLVQLGQLFYGALAPIAWTSTHFGYPPLDDSMRMLRLYHERLAAFMRELGWRA
jgi:hypothetical protein